MIDVHIASSANRPAEWLHKAVESVNVAPVNLSIIRGRPRQLGAVRAHGYSFGSAPYVCAVDDDDWVAPGAFDRLIDVMDSNPRLAAVYTDWCVVDASGTVIDPHRKRRDWSPQLHIDDRHLVANLTVYRRSAIAPHLDGLKRWHNHEQHWLSAMATRAGDIARVAEPLYVMRDHHQPRASRDRTAEETRACLEEVKPELMAAWREGRCQPRALR